MIQEVAIQFDQFEYVVMEDIGLENFALRTCFTITGLQSPMNVTVFTEPVTADGRLYVLLKKGLIIIIL